MEIVNAGAVILGLGMAALGISWVWRASARPGIIERLERAMTSNQDRLEAQERKSDEQDREIEDLRRQILELREGRIADHALLQEWIAYARRLAAMFREATGKEPPPEPAGQPRPISPADMRRLARTIEARFSLVEMTTLEFDLGIDGAVSGDTLEARARSIVSVAQKRGLTARLIELIREKRKDVEI